MLKIFLSAVLNPLWISDNALDLPDNRFSAAADDHSGAPRYGIVRLLFVLTAFLLLVSISPIRAETTHETYFKGEDIQLDVYVIKGAKPGPTLLLIGGIQGDEPGGYLAADLYADISLQQGNMIVIPRANFPSVVGNMRGLHGDMNRKFALEQSSSDKEISVVGIIKGLMKRSDFFLNLHDGSGFYASTWVSPMKNPMRFGQSIIADAAVHTLPDGKQISMEDIVEQVLEKVNLQIPYDEHHFHFNNHRTLASDSKHKEQRLSATFHALTKVGIPAFGIETSKNIKDFSTRVRYQTLVVNAFLEQFGIIPETPKVYLDNPFLKFLILSVNGQVPIVVKNGDVVKVEPNDVIRIMHIEANYSRGLTARVKGSGKRLDDVNRDIPVKENTVIEIRKDRFLMASIPLETVSAGTRPSKDRTKRGRNRTADKTKVSRAPSVHYFCVRVNDKPVLLEPSERLTVMRGDLLTLMDPRTNLEEEDEKQTRIDLRGFQAESSPNPSDDRGHCIDTASDLQAQYGRVEEGATVYALQAKLGKAIIAESQVAVVEPKLEYVVFKKVQGIPFLAYDGDKLEVPGPSGIVEIVDLKTNAPDDAPLFINLAGKQVKWARSGSAAIDSSKLTSSEIPLEITRNGQNLGKIWLKQGTEFRLSKSGADSSTPPVVKVKFE